MPAPPWRRRLRANGAVLSLPPGLRAFSAFLMTSKFVAFALFVWFLVQTASTVPAMAQGRGGASRLAVSSTQTIRQWDTLVDSLERAGELRLRQHRVDTLKAGRDHDHLDQYYKGV